MQHVFLLSAYETTAMDFFERLKAEGTELVLDVRLNNSSQLCGFTKMKDLAFFVPQLTGAVYIHDLELAPTKGLLELYTHKRIDWEDYAAEYLRLLRERRGAALYHARYDDYRSVCLLGTGTKKRRSHNEILLSAIQ